MNTLNLILSVLVWSQKISVYIRKYTTIMTVQQYHSTAHTPVHTAAAAIKRQRLWVLNCDHWDDIQRSEAGGACNLFSLCCVNPCASWATHEEPPTQLTSSDLLQFPSESFSLFSEYEIIKCGKGHPNTSSTWRRCYLRKYPQQLKQKHILKVMEKQVAPGGTWSKRLMCFRCNKYKTNLSAVPFSVQAERILCVWLCGP